MFTCALTYVVFTQASLVFGVELEFLLRRETGSDEISPGTVPIVIEQCLTEVEGRGLTEVGICKHFRLF